MKYKVGDRFKLRDFLYLTFKNKYGIITYASKGDYVLSIGEKNMHCKLHWIEASADLYLCKCEVTNLVF